MLETKENFGHRLMSLGRKHQAMANGYTTQIRGDGLIVIKPKRKAPRAPLRSLILVAVGFFAFKAFTVMSLGDVTYSERVDALRSGTTVEQMGAWAMQIDPVTQAMITAYTDLTN